MLQALTRRWRLSKRSGSGPIFRIEFWAQLKGFALVAHSMTLIRKVYIRICGPAAVFYRNRWSNRGSGPLDRWWLPLAIIAVIGYSVLPSLAASSKGKPAHDVKYFFEHIEHFSEELTGRIEQSSTVRGRLVTFHLPVQCKTVPCLSPEVFAFQDPSDEQYKMQIFEDNSLLRELKIGQIYVLIDSLRTLRSLKTESET
ncbi:MAG: hypothetical protein HY282_05270 [Nitrospirae bacterium]|nr:hypothetical protein [Candidatus Manganitrophaceae bacterium]